jgi:hypothetical protein
MVTPRATQPPVDNVKIFLDFIQSKKIKENYDASPSTSATPPSHNPDGVVVSIVQGTRTKNMNYYYDDDTTNMRGITYIQLSNDLLDAQTLLINMYKQFIGLDPQLCYTNLQPVTYRVEFFGHGFSDNNYPSIDPNSFFTRISKNIKMLTWYIAYSIFTNGDVNILRDMGALVIANYVLKTTASPELWSLTRFQSNSVDTSVIFNRLDFDANSNGGLLPIVMKDIGYIFNLDNYFRRITYPVSPNYQKLMNAAKSYLSPTAATDMQNILNSRDQTSATILIEDVGRLLILNYYNGWFDSDTC